MLTYSENRASEIERFIKNGRSGILGYILAHLP